jgi:hypothetical protein
MLVELLFVLAWMLDAWHGCQAFLPTAVSQVDGCSARLSNCKGYYQRYRVCQQHLAAESVFIDGVESRFCQQCGRFQELSEFDDTKR